MDHIYVPFLGQKIKRANSLTSGKGQTSGMFQKEEKR